MFVRYQLLAGLLGTTALATVSYAGVSDTVLEEIENGTRTIREEVTSLKQIPVPEPENLYDFVADKDAAIALGKALFWDMQLGSDGIQACASCHFAAGADNRAKNQLSPGLLIANQDGTPAPDNSFDENSGPNFHLSSTDFPRHLKADPLLFTSEVLRDSNDVVSSMGPAYSVFGSDEFEPDPDGFQVDGINTRRVEPRNTPTVINAVFNHRQFWDGRASNIFNGVNSSGDSDPYAFVYRSGPGGRGLRAVRVRIDNASLASQALAPPTSSLEMSADGRTWIDIGDQFVSGRRLELPRKRGRRAFGLRPLANQMVHPADSVLGPLARNNRPGLRVPSYAIMIRQAFRPEWWRSRKCIKVHEDGSRSIENRRGYSEDGDDVRCFSQMAMNFSLFFGLAVQLYEATLVADDSPVDRFLDGDEGALSESELIGFHLADDEARCINCHGGGEFTFASVSRINQQGLTRIRRGDLIDEGFNNIGVRPTLEDLGIGGTDPFGNPLGFARQTHLGLFDNELIDGIDDELAADLADDGAFKIPTLRNVELTAPYFHNGSELTLEDTIDFYFRGGNFRTFNPEENHPIIGFSADRTEESKITGLGILRGELLNSGPGLDDVDKANIVAFLKALTDPRVRYEQAPFDHPQLFVPAGHPGDHTSVIDDGTGSATDTLVEIPAVGAAGGPGLPLFEDDLLDSTAGAASFAAGNDGLLNSSTTNASPAIAAKGSSTSQQSAAGCNASGNSGAASMLLGLGFALSIAMRRRRRTLAC